MKPGKLLMLLVATGHIGCSAIQHDAWQQETVAFIGKRVGTEVSMVNSADESRIVGERVRALLSEPLDAHSALTIAMLNNRSVQALLAEVGIARAELLAASAYANPKLDADLRFESGGILNVEAALIQSVLDLLFVPLRRSVAEEAYQGEKARLTAAVIGVATDVRKAFIDYVAAVQSEEVRVQAVAAAELSAELSRRLHAAGNVSDLQHFTERAQSERSRLALAGAREAVIIARERLNDLMGLWGEDVSWHSEGRLPDPSGDSPTVSEVERCAVARSLQLASLQHALEAASQRAGFASWEAVTGEVHVGGTYSHEESTDKYGPAFSIPIPLFNWGQADKTRALAELRRLEHEYYALAVRVRAEARVAWSRLQSAERRTQQSRKVIIPLHRQVTAETQKHYNAMLLGAFDLFRAKQEEIESGIDYIEALRDYWTARAQLDGLLAGVVGDLEQRKEAH